MAESSSLPSGSLARRQIPLFVVVALIAWAVDQATKQWAVVELTGREPVQLIGTLLQLRLVRNPGAAFSTGSDYTIVFTCIAMVATGVVLWFGSRVRTKLWAVGLGLLLAGITGNLADRIVREPRAFHGHVVDFFELPNWPIFNVADICINVAAVVIVIQAFRGIGVDGRREGADEPGPESAPDKDTARG